MYIAFFIKFGPLVVNHHTDCMTTFLVGTACHIGTLHLVRSHLGAGPCRGLVMPGATTLYDPLPISSIEECEKYGHLK